MDHERLQGGHHLRSWVDEPRAQHGEDIPCASPRALTKKIPLVHHAEVIRYGEVAVPHLGEPAAVAKQGAAFEDP
jgi:hypothetical protein